MQQELVPDVTEGAKTQGKHQMTDVWKGCFFFSSFFKLIIILTSVPHAIETIFENVLTVMGFPTVNEFCMRSQASRNSICIFTIQILLKYFTGKELGANNSSVSRKI